MLKYLRIHREAYDTSRFLFHVILLKFYNVGPSSKKKTLVFFAQVVDRNDIDADNKLVNWMIIWTFTSYFWKHDDYWTRIYLKFLEFGFGCFWCYISKIELWAFSGFITFIYHIVWEFRTVKKLKRKFPIFL